MSLKKLWIALLLVPLVALAASTFTTNYNMEKPADGSLNWGEAIRDNLDTIDTQMNINATATSDHIADAVGAHAASAISSTAGAAVCTTSTDVQDFLDCIDAQLNTLAPGGAVDISSAQTITGVKTFSATPIFSALGTGVIHSDGGGNLTSSTIVDADVNASAAISRSKLGTGTANYVVINGASGEFSEEQFLAISRGGTAANTATAAFDNLSPVTTRGDIIIRDASNNVRLAVGAADTVLRSDGTDPSYGKIVDANIDTTSSIPVWTKLTFAHTAFQTAATVNTIELVSFSAQEAIQGIIIKHSTAFSGGAISAYTVEVGITGNLDEYASPFDIFQATGDTVKQATQVLDVPSFSGVTSVKITARSVGANLDQSSAGSVDVWIKTSVLP